MKTTLTGADTVTWELTHDGKSIAMPEGFTKDGGMFFFMEAGRYTLKGTVENSGGTAVCEKTLEVLPIGDIAFSLPEYGYTDRAEDVKLLTKNDLTGSVIWTLTKDGTAQNLTSFTRDGGTLSLTETGKYTLTATLMDAAGKKYTASQSITILTDHMMLQATELGLGSVWVCYFKPDILCREFGLPANLEPVNILVIGYAGENFADPERHSQMRIPVSELVSYESL